MDPTIMRDDTLGEDHKYHRLTQILRPQSAPADGKVMAMEADQQGFPRYPEEQLVLGEERESDTEARLRRGQQRKRTSPVILNYERYMDEDWEAKEYMKKTQMERSQRRRREEEYTAAPKKQAIQDEKVRAAEEAAAQKAATQEHRLRVNEEAKKAEEQKRIIAELQRKRAFQESKAQYHMDMPGTTSQQRIGGYGGPHSKQLPLDELRSRPMSKERQSKTAHTLSAQAEASGSKFPHHYENQKNSTLAPDQTNLPTPISTMEVGCADLEEHEETGQDHDSDAMFDTTSTGVFDTMNDGYPAQTETSWVDSRPTFHIPQRRRVDRSISPASFTEFSCGTCHQAKVQLRDLHSKIFDLEAENQQLKAMIQPYVELKWVTIYEIFEDRSIISWYEDQPRWLQTQGRQVFLGGKKRISNLEAFLHQLQLGKVPFIVFQEFANLRRPDIFTQHIQDLPHPTPSNVSMQIISNTLSNILETLLDTHSELKEHAEFGQILYKNGDRILDGDDSDARRISTRLVNIDLLYFHFQDLFEEGLHLRMEDDRSEKELLLRFLRTSFERNHAQARRLLLQKKIDRNTIFYLFRPGAVIVSQKNPRIRGLKQMKFLCTSPLGWELDCQSWTFDGKFQRAHNTLFLADQDLKDGPVNITSLPFYPLEYAQPDIVQKLHHRGETFWRFRRPIYVTYSGFNMRGDLTYDQARFLIDPVTWKRSQQGASALKGETWDCTIAQPNELDEGLMLQDDLPSAEFPYLVPENITGFNMQDKKWVDLQVDNISEVEWDKKSFDNLAIAEENKRIIKALVLNKIERDKATDVVPGKGNGLVVLLHGGPGTGKTLTAETVADLAQKPLYRVTCGDIGTDPRGVEEYLENVFFLGKIWDCVVLLDEADVFLEQRSLSDLPRNALVSVFLRTLEYYDGILILTSNRVGTFDEAFKSRIQLALHYDSLNGEQRKHIWYTFIKRLEELDEPIEARDIYTNMETLSMKQLNGRQIRNAITTARQLALFEGDKLNFRHLQESIKVSGQFDEYLQELHGPDDRRMQNEGIRLAPKSDSK